MAIGNPNRDGTAHPNGTRAILHRSDRLTIARWSILMAPWIGSCSPIEDDLIRNTAWIWTFLISLLLFVLGGGFLVFSLYRKQLRNWDLQRNPGPPRSHSGIVLIASSIVIWVLFTLFHLSISMPSGQHLKNLLGWLVGSVLGGLFAYWGGRRLAVDRYRRSCQDA